MKIAYLTGEYPRATDTFIQREVAQLRKLGFEVETCSIRRTDAAHLVGPEQREEAKQTFHVLPAFASLRGLGTLLRNLGRGSFWGALGLAWRTAPRGVKGRLYNLIYLAEAAVLADRMQAHGITHLHNHIAKASCTVAMLASRISGIPFSFTLHGPDIFFEPHHWRLDEKIARAQFVACISHFCRSQAMVFSAPEHWAKLHIVHCGVEPDRYGARDRPSGRASVLFVGRLAGVKGVPVLLRTCAALRASGLEFDLTLVGDGPERASHEALVSELGLTGVTFAGYQSQSRVAELLAGADMLVLPSFAEGVPVVLMEAMAAQVPVVTTRIAGVPELVEDGVSGLLVPPGDDVALGVAMSSLLDDADLRARMGAAGREKVLAEFDIAQEAAWLGHLVTAHHEGRTPGLRPGAA
ncbi:glycosyltransferase [Pseudaestuariivita atlantica]|uniref:Glycosyl transferase family 1 n=1 Tax=Pseudaestuariivita atlantica TaxID=1317121 RepID=A0A0L1JQ66_9RHOB|nr:glycosyltransferase [Pseudaestuariivita atlantica]KNG93538.1 glycosyl transferase family 1 [Pseudaestuariivita atlantica]